jgi:hypothetical protein
MNSTSELQTFAENSTDIIIILLISLTLLFSYLFKGFQRWKTGS